VSISPWSFSRIKAFEQCPKQFYHVKIAKDYVEEETKAMRYGTDAHAAAEEYMCGNTPMPKKFMYMKPDVWNAHPSGLCKRHCVVIECIHNGSN
jgi:hypothetical protein